MINRGIKYPAASDTRFGITSTPSRSLTNWATCATSKLRATRPLFPRFPKSISGFTTSLVEDSHVSVFTSSVKSVDWVTWRTDKLTINWKAVLATLHEFSYEWPYIYSQKLAKDWANHRFQTAFAAETSILWLNHQWRGKNTEQNQRTRSSWRNSKLDILISRSSVKIWNHPRNSNRYQEGTTSACTSDRIKNKHVEPEK